MSHCEPVSAGGDRAARIESVLLLAAEISNDYRATSTMGRDDWYQSAVAAAIGAVDSFDSSRGLALASWVALRVRWELSAVYRAEKRRSRGLCADGWSEAAAAEQTDDVDVAELLAVLPTELESLPRRDRAILRRSFGLYGARAESCRALAKRFHCCEDTIRRRRGRALETLRSRLSES